MSHTATVLSKEPVRIWLPVVLKLAHITSAEWPCMWGCVCVNEGVCVWGEGVLTARVCSSAPVMMFHSLTVVSILPVATNVLWGLNATHTISAVCPRKVWKHFPVWLHHNWTNTHTHTHTSDYNTRCHHIELTLQVLSKEPVAILSLLRKTQN